MIVRDLSRRFAIPNHVAVTEGKNGLIMVEVTTDHAKAVISTYAGQVLSYCPTGQPDLMFQSNSAYFTHGKPIKGGAPICWPWFGPDPEGKGRPGHGFARNSQWELQGTEKRADGSIRVTLGLNETDETRILWPHAFRLTQEITVGAMLDIALITCNLDSKPFALSQALHTYFQVGDIAQTQILGLEGCAYVDKANNDAEMQQSGSVTITSETDRVYSGVHYPLVIQDGALGRHIHVAATGSTSAVVWNPWATISKAMADLGDDDYHRMICVETTNTGPDTITLAPGAEHRLWACYSLTEKQ